MVALAGGETPRRTYRRLAAEPRRSQVAWSQVVVLWGDERCVPADSADSNYRMAKDALLDHVAVRPEHVHRIHGEEDPATAAAKYETTLRGVFGTPTGPPRAGVGTAIDLVLLGLGADGHTASLFPGSAAARERSSWVVAAYAAAVSMWRITLTAEVINAAMAVSFIVSGGTKAEILRQVRHQQPGGVVLPAQLIAPSNGQVRWLVDAAAAAMLDDVPP
ncbi:MAG: 6-phosphogluconolactonase [Gemmatimonadales bacterium]